MLDRRTVVALMTLATIRVPAEPERSVLVRTAIPRPEVQIRITSGNVPRSKGERKRNRKERWR